MQQILIRLKNVYTLELIIHVHVCAAVAAGAADPPRGVGQSWDQGAENPASEHPSSAQTTDPDIDLLYEYWSRKLVYGYWSRTLTKC